MPGVFLFIALLLFGIVALLYAASGRQLLNFVDYGDTEAVVRINRHAAKRLLLPVTVNLGCAWIAALYPHLLVPLVFVIPLSILGAVVWIAAGVHRLKTAP